MQGTVTRVNLDRHFGFIGPVGKPDVYFNARDLRPDLAFDEQLQGRRVEFETKHTPRGLAAVGVRPAK